MSIPPGINVRKCRLSIVHTPAQPSVAPAQHQAEARPSMIEKGIRLNRMQKEVLKKFENMQSGARDLSTKFAQLPRDNAALTRCGLVQVKKISEK